ncbi:MAG: fused MFS/spermidine synthase [Verrucomicrobiota bacterium]|jgi:spermidine synthase
MRGILNFALKRAVWLCAMLCCITCQATVIFDRISAYNYIQVIDEGDLRRLSFNGSWETKMSLADPLKGHFEYTEYFQMPWLWNTNIHRVLMAGLGGGSTQRAYQHYYTNVMVDTVESDPVVISVARKYFHVTETPMLQIHTNDARLYLRRATNTYDAILMDAYTTTRYGSSLPPHLTTREFFAIADGHLNTNGVLAYNVIGQIQGYRANVIGALYRTMKEVFPQVYMFPANESQNVVLVGTKSKEHFDEARVRREAAALTRSGTVTLPTFYLRLRNFINEPPPSATGSPVLTDDYAPIESLLQGSQ